MAGVRKRGRYAASMPRRYHHRPPPVIAATGHATRAKGLSRHTSPHSRPWRESPPLPLTSGPDIMPLHLALTPYQRPLTSLQN